MMGDAIGIERIQARTEDAKVLKEEDGVHEEGRVDNHN